MATYTGYVELENKRLDGLARAGTWLANQLSAQLNLDEHRVAALRQEGVNEQSVKILDEVEERIAFYRSVIEDYKSMR